MAQFFVDITGDEEAIEFQHLTKLFDIGFTPLELAEELKKSGVFNEDGLPDQHFVDCGYFRVVEMKYGIKAMTMSVCCHEASHACDAIENGIDMEHGGEPSAYLIG